MKSGLLKVILAIVIFVGLIVVCATIKAKQYTQNGENQLLCQTHMQSFGWEEWTGNGIICGRTASAKRLEAFSLRLLNQSHDGNITYQSYIENEGWQSLCHDGQPSGTTGLGKAIQAVKLSLTGEMAEQFNLYYRVYVEDIGWEDWVKNGEEAGKAGRQKHLEAFEIKLVVKGGISPISIPDVLKQDVSQKTEMEVAYQAHVQKLGWQEMVFGGVMAGTTDYGFRLEALKVTVLDTALTGNILCRSHVQGTGWQPWKCGGEITGTVGEGRRMEAVQIKFTGELAAQYDVYYRAYVEGYGWLGWAKNGETAGTEYMARQMEAIEIMVKNKGMTAPGVMAEACRRKTQPSATIDASYIIQQAAKKLEKQGKVFLPNMREFQTAESGLVVEDYSIENLIAQTISVNIQAIESTTADDACIDALVSFLLKQVSYGKFYIEFSDYGQNGEAEFICYYGG